MRTPSSLSLSLCNPPLTFERLNQSLWNLVMCDVYYGIWAYLNGILLKSLPCLGQQQIHIQLWTRRFLCGPCLIQGGSVCLCIPLLHIVECSENCRRQQRWLLIRIDCKIEIENKYLWRANVGRHEISSQISSESQKRLKRPNYVNLDSRDENYE
jgi:hypothetical protein